MNNSSYLFLNILVPNNSVPVDMYKQSPTFFPITKSLFQLPVCKYVVCKCFVTAQTRRQTKRRNKRVLNFVQRVFFLLSTEGSIVITRAYPALYLGGTPSQETGTSPLAVYSLRTIYIYQYKPMFKIDFSLTPQCDPEMLVSL